MAITATTALSSATAKNEQPVTATVTITNSGSVAVNVTAFVPSAVPTGQTPKSVSVALGAPPTGPGMTTSVPGSNGTLAISFPVVAHAPTSGWGLAEPSSFVYDIGALISTSDGSLTQATTTTLTVSNINLGASN